MSYVCVCVCVLGFVCECPTSWSILTIRAKEVLAQWSLFLCQNNTSSHLSGTEKLITIGVFFYFFQLTKSTLFKLWHFWTGSVKQAWIICQWGSMCFFFFCVQLYILLHLRMFYWHIVSANPDIRKQGGRAAGVNREDLFPGNKIPHEPIFRHSHICTRATSLAVNEACVGKLFFSCTSPSPPLPLLLQCVFISYFKAMFSQEMLDYIYKLKLERLDKERLLKH